MAWKKPFRCQLRSDLRYHVVECSNLSEALTSGFLHESLQSYWTSTSAKSLNVCTYLTSKLKTSYILNAFSWNFIFLVSGCDLFIQRTFFIQDFQNQAVCSWVLGCNHNLKTNCFETLNLWVETFWILQSLHNLRMPTIEVETLYRCLSFTATELYTSENRRKNCRAGC